MKTNYLRSALLLIAATALTTAANAQKPGKKTALNSYNNYDTFDGKGRERIQTDWNGKTYQMELANNKLVALAVDGEIIPSTKWGEYSTVIAAIREQIRKDRIQAKKDQAQAKRDQEQAGRDQQQAKRDQEQAERDQRQAKVEQEDAARDQQQAKRDQEQASKDQVQAKRDQEQASRDQEQAKRDQEQASRDQVQAKHDQEQAHLDQIQAKKDQERAAEDQRLLKQMTGDLVADHIIPNEDALRELSMNGEEMIVNGVKQPESVFKKYSAKYPRFAQGNTSYENGKRQFNGLHIHRN
ncbi:hypothetical protein [Mucilaginibacter sp. NFR10]|uniref:hypothetical protein n=1 Tax=Mucilaginibacter sp. NFR10 TaxID=1566292 RepID=UPI0008715EBC|nr:hypothetical protein [Mucilaginibacter sp. NFR10]SCW39874.1 hypothetical protein SAMN03159284_00277 [Mucilaginibacter sp. NFR10]